MCEVDTYIYEERSFLCPVVRNRSVKIAKIDQHDGIAAGFEITAAILEIASKSQKQARYGTEKNVSQMCGTKMNTHASDASGSSDSQLAACLDRLGIGKLDWTLPSTPHATSLTMLYASK